MWEDRDEPLFPLSYPFHYFFDPSFNLSRFRSCAN